MTGIYKITNLINNKIYIGQSVDIKRRWYYYTNPPKELDYKSKIIPAIKKYGIENFKFEILEECPIDQLDERESYYINFYNSIIDGYNIIEGGQGHVGEANPNATLKEEDVVLIRKIYNSKTSKKKIDIYNELFINKCSLRAFEKVWNGETWTHIMPEVFTEENKNYYNTIAKSSKGETNPNAIFTDEEVLILRERYVKETTSEILKDYEGVISYSGLERILIGGSYSHLPVYKKRLKKWIIK